MATNNVSTFLQTINQGIKPNMFSVDISFPTDGAGDAANTDVGMGTTILRVVA